MYFAPGFIIDAWRLPERHTRVWAIANHSVTSGPCEPCGPYVGAPRCTCPVGSVSVLICTGGPVHSFGRSPQPLRAAATARPGQPSLHHLAVCPRRVLEGRKESGHSTRPRRHTHTHTRTRLMLTRTHTQDHSEWQWLLFTRPSHPPSRSFHPLPLVCHVVCHFPQMSVPPWDSD